MYLLMGQILCISHVSRDLSLIIHARNERRQERVLRRVRIPKQSSDLAKAQSRVLLQEGDKTLQTGEWSSFSWGAWFCIIWCLMNSYPSAPDQHLFWLCLVRRKNSPYKFLHVLFLRKVPSKSVSFLRHCPYSRPCDCHSSSRKLFHLFLSSVYPVCSPCCSQRNLSEVTSDNNTSLLKILPLPLYPTLNLIHTKFPSASQLCHILPPEKLFPLPSTPSPFPQSAANCLPTFLEANNIHRSLNFNATPLRGPLQSQSTH